MDIDDMEYLGEEIKIGGKARHVKYTIKGLKLLSKQYGSVAAAFGKMQTMNQEFDTETMDNLVLLLQAGLIHEDKGLTTDDVENMLTMANMLTVFNMILRAFGQSMPKPEEGSEATAGE